LLEDQPGTIAGRAGAFEREVRFQEPAIEAGRPTCAKLAKIRLGLFHSALPSLDADLLERVSQIDSLTCSLRLHSDPGRGGELPESPGDLAH
jgi:hypothetical protein